MFHVKQEQSGRRAGAAGASVSRLKFTSWCATTPKPQGAGTPGSCPDPLWQSKPGRLAKLDSGASNAWTSEQEASSLTELLHSQRSLCSAVLALVVPDAGCPSE